jgi:hypothetical protein
MTFPSSSLWQTTTPAAFVELGPASCSEALDGSVASIASIALDISFELELELNRFLDPLRGIVNCKL